MTDNKKIIRGSFGGGSKPSPPPTLQTPDTLATASSLLHFRFNF